MEISKAKYVDSTPLKERVLNADGTIRVLPANEWLSFGWDMVRWFMHEYPIYVLPTQELIFKLAELIDGYKTIEIGAGSGNIGRNLGIRMTDSYLQERKDIKMYYSAMGQPTIKYPKDVWRSDALSATKVLKPECVLGCYVTHYSLEGEGNSWGVDFPRLIKMVKRLILVGNKHIHSANPIMSLPHEEIALEGLLTRNDDRDADRIFVW